MYNLYKTHPAENFGRLFRDLCEFYLGGRSSARLFNILQFIPSTNPLVIARYYIFKRFTNMMFQSDVIEALYLAAYRNISERLSHIIVLGLERTAGKRKQRRFLKMVQATIDRLAALDSMGKRPLTGRISIYGKLDAKMRRNHIELGKGEIQFQQLD
jgi:hypothetical protein